MFCLFQASLDGDDDRPENLMFMPFGRNHLQNITTTYGAVSVSAQNLYRLLKQGERILLYPGGAREAFKLKDEKYRLFWPETAEFVRMAAKLNATIVTIAAVGLEDWLEIALDREDILQFPILKDIAQNQIDNSPEARPGVSKESGDIFLMVSVKSGLLKKPLILVLQPLVTPKVPKRHYFLFGKPFSTTIEQYEDKEKGQKLYQQVTYQSHFFLYQGMVV